MDNDIKMDINDVKSKRTATKKLRNDTWNAAILIYKRDALNEINS